ncbi:MAG: hypothetical protein ACWGQW_11325, partial [bacterium]
PPEALAKITKIKGLARQYHYYVTLPWSRGWGILPSVLFFDYMEEQRKYRVAFENAVEDLKDNLPDFVERDRIELGDLFDPANYPTISSLENSFHFRVSTLPIPDKGHFIVDLQEEGLEELQAMTEATIRSQIEEAQKAPWQRLLGAVSKMVERLSDPDKKFHDTLIENVASICNVLPSFSTITGDEELEEIRKEVEAKLLQTSADVLRDNKKVRKNVANEAAEIMKKMEAYKGLF